MRLLLLHPLPLDGTAHPAGLWNLGVDVVAPTLYGVGDDLADWATAAIDAVGDGPIVVVGTSIGGSCAIEAARLAPTRVAGLVLTGTNPGHRPEPALRDEALRVLDEQGVAAAWARYWRPLFGPSVPAEIVDGAEATATRVGATALASGVRAFHGRADRSGFLASCRLPIAVVSGEHDIRPDRSRSLAASLPTATFHLLPGTGHYVPIEAPEALTAVVRDVLDRVADRRSGQHQR